MPIDRIVTRAADHCQRYPPLEQEMNQKIVMLSETALRSWGHRVDTCCPGPSRTARNGPLIFPVWPRSDRLLASRNVL